MKSLAKVNYGKNISILSEAKHLMGITNKLLSKNNIVTIDDEWMDKLWKWAEEHYENNFMKIEHGEDSWRIDPIILPEKREDMIELERLELEFTCLEKIPDLIINFKKLKFVVLPFEIVLSENQKQWLSELDRKGCEIIFFDSSAYWNNFYNDNGDEYNHQIKYRFNEINNYLKSR